MTKKALRALHLNKEALENTAEWALLTPYDLRHEAMRDFLKALKATRARRNKKRKVELAIDRNHIEERTIFFSFTTANKKRESKTKN